MMTTANIRHAVDLTGAEQETHGDTTYITAANGTEYISSPTGLTPIVVVGKVNAKDTTRIIVRPDLIEPVGNALAYYLVTLAPPQTMQDQPRPEQMQCRLTVDTFPNEQGEVVADCTRPGTQNHQQWTELLGDAAHGIGDYGYRTEANGAVTFCYYPVDDRKGGRLHLHFTREQNQHANETSTAQHSTIAHDWEGKLWQVWEHRSCGLPRCLCDAAARPLLMQHGDEEVQARVVVGKGGVVAPGEAPLPTMKQWREWTRAGSSRKGTMPYAPKEVK